MPFHIPKVCICWHFLFLALLHNLCWCSHNEPKLKSLASPPLQHRLQKCKIGENLNTCRTAMGLTKSCFTVLAVDVSKVQTALTKSGRNGCAMKRCKIIEMINIILLVPQSKWSPKALCLTIIAITMIIIIIIIITATITITVITKNN